MESQQLILVLFRKVILIDNHLLKVLLRSSIFEDPLLFGGQLPDEVKNVLRLLVFPIIEFLRELVKSIFVLYEVGAVQIEPPNFRGHLVDLLPFELEGSYGVRVENGVLGDPLLALQHKPVIFNIFKVLQLEIEPEDPFSDLPVFFFTLGPLSTYINFSQSTKLCPLPVDNIREDH